MDDWEQELGRLVGEVQSELAKSEQCYEDLYRDYEKLREKVIEVACLKHIIDKGDAGSEEAEQFDDSFAELEDLVNGGNPLPNLWPKDELEALKAKVREIIRIADCIDCECSIEDYLKMWEELRELAK